MIYRLELLTIMMMLGDQRDELVKIRRLLESEDGGEEAEEDADR